MGKFYTTSDYMRSKTVDKEQLMNLLVHNCVEPEDSLRERDLLVTQFACEYGATGLIVYALNGSPVRAFAVYEVGRKRLHVKSAQGGFKRTFQDVETIWKGEETG